MGCFLGVFSWIFVVIPNIFYFHPENWGRFPFWRAYFSDGLKPPTSGSFTLFCFQLGFLRWSSLKFGLNSWYVNIFHIWRLRRSFKHLDFIGGFFLTCVFFDKGNPSLEVEVDYFLNGFSAKTIVLVRAWSKIAGDYSFPGLLLLSVLKSFRGKCTVILWDLVAAAGTLLFFGFVRSHRTGTPGKSWVYLVGFLLH